MSWLQIAQPFVLWLHSNDCHIPDDRNNTEGHNLLLGCHPSRVSEPILEPAVHSAQYIRTYLRVRVRL